MIGLLTGTFDPIHRGHVAIAQAALAQCRLEAVWFWPNPDPAHKLCRVDFTDRLAMLQLALVDVADQRLQLAPLAETDLYRPHVLAEFLEVLRGYPEDAFRFIVGMDTLSHLDTWKDAQSIVDSTSYIAVHRSGTSYEDVRQLRQRLGVAGERLQVEFIELAQPALVSSTVVRHELALGHKVLDVAPPVRQYIQHTRLYRVQP